MNQIRTPRVVVSKGVTQSDLNFNDCSICHVENITDGKNRSKEANQGDHENRSGGGKKWLNSEYILKVEPPTEWNVNRNFHKCLQGFWSKQL